MGKIVRWCLILMAFATVAAIPVRQASTEKQGRYLDLGVFVGGRDHGALSLLNVRHSSTSDFERLVLDIGAKTNKATDLERPGFFHISIQEKPARIVADLESVTDSVVTADQIERLLRKSHILGPVSLYKDAAHKSMTVEFSLKTAAQVEVFELATPGKPGRIVLDIKKL